MAVARSQVSVRNPRAFVLGERAAPNVRPNTAAQEKQSGAQPEHLQPGPIHFQTPCWTHNRHVPELFHGRKPTLDPKGLDDGLRPDGARDHSLIGIYDGLFVFLAHCSACLNRLAHNMPSQSVS
jgi:hypothetical protein